MSRFKSISKALKAAVTAEVTRRGAKALKAVYEGQKEFWGERKAS